MNEERFTGKADIYDKYRPTYPQELIDYLYYEVGFSGIKTVADIGMGTGIFTRLLLERDISVCGVEPNADMLRVAKENLKEFRNIFYFKNKAEKTGISEQTMDFVTAAQAFHWFDRQAFKLECQRILKPGGKVVIIWNNRDDSNEFVIKDYDIRKKYAVGDKKGLSTLGSPPLDLSDFFADGLYDYKTFRNDLILNREDYTGMNLTRSYSPKEEQEPEEYHGFVKEMNELFDEYNIDGILNYPHFTESYVGGV